VGRSSCARLTSTASAVVTSAASSAARSPGDIALSEAKWIAVTPSFSTRESKFGSAARSDGPSQPGGTWTTHERVHAGSRTLVTS